MVLIIVKNLDFLNSFVKFVNVFDCFVLEFEYSSCGGVSIYIEYYVVFGFFFFVDIGELFVGGIVEIYS